MLNFKKIKKLINENPALYFKVLKDLEKPFISEMKVFEKGNSVIFIDGYRFLPLFIESKDILVDVKKSLSKKEYPEGLFMDGVNHEYFSLIKEVFPETNIETVCNAFLCEQENIIPVNRKVETLLVSDAEEVNSFWPFKWDDNDFSSSDMFEGFIRQFPTAAIRIDGELAAFGLTYNITFDFINFGHLFVKEKFRKKGLGNEITKHLLNRAYEMGKKAVVHIVEGNVPSRSLSEKAGFKKIGKVMWGDLII